MKLISNKSLILTLFRFLEKDKKKFILWNIPLIINNLLDLAQPLLVGLIINYFATYSELADKTYFIKLILLLLVVTITQATLRNIARGALFYIQADLEYTIKIRGFESISNNTIAWNSTENSGNKIQRLETGKSSLLELIDFIREDFYYIVLNIVTILTIFIATNYLYAIFFIVYMILYFGLTKYWDRNNPTYLNRLNSAREKASGKTFETINNILSIKSLGATKSVQKTISGVQHELREAIKSWERLGILKWSSISILDLVFLVGFLLLMGFSLSSKIIDVGIIFVLYSYFSRLQDITGSLSKKYTQIIEIKSNVSRLLPLFETTASLFGSKAFIKDWKKINISDGYFEYPAEDKKVVLKNIQFEINSRDFIGIIGQSGAGKSTILKLLLGLYKLKSGIFEVDSKSYYQFSLRSILEKMSVILQDTELFNDSLLQNITMYKEVNLVKLKKAIEVSNLNEVIKDLPDGINTVIGEKGATLSGGQRQRIGIARAIYKDTPILLMDEATSNLDIKTEKKVIDSILKMTPRKTIIAVAHRTSTIESANKVYEVRNGKILLVK